MTFTYDGTTLALLDHPYNQTATNERAVEIPVALHFLATYGHGDVLELGNVLGHYGCTMPRRIVDLWEPGPGVENIDVFAVEGTYDVIVSVSTLEHVGWDDEQDPVAAWEALEHLRDLLEPDDGRAFVTVPLGWNPTLDTAIAEGWVPAVCEAAYARGQGGWHEVDPRTRASYDHAHHSANVVWLAELAHPAREDVGTW